MQTFIAGATGMIADQSQNLNERERRLTERTDEQLFAKAEGVLLSDIDAQDKTLDSENRKTLRKSQVR